MKKIKYLFISFAMLLGTTLNTITINAKEIQFNNVVSTKESGFNVETIITEDVNLSRVNQKSGTKTVNYYDGNTLLWSVSVRGTFNYTGSSATCVSSTVNGSSNHSSWNVGNLSAWRSGNTAYASGVGTKVFLGVSIQTVSRTVSLTCSPNGTLS